MDTPFLDAALTRTIFEMSLEDRERDFEAACEACDLATDELVNENGEQIPGVTLNGGPVFNTYLGDDDNA